MSVGTAADPLSGLRPNLRAGLYFALYALRGQPVGRFYHQILRETREGIPPETTERQLRRMLDHCRRHVPYYTQIMHEAGDGWLEDPKAYLARLPILTRELVRINFDDLTSDDLGNRRWHFNTSGGSTGEPVRFIQDREYETRAGAVKLLFPRLVGYEVGEAEVKLWGSHRDIANASADLRARLLGRLSNTTMLDGFEMAPEQMRHYVSVLNTVRPRLITAYADAMFELARFAERECLEIRPQSAIITSAGMLLPFMREKIETVFRCRVYNKYGSREVGDVACERPGLPGMWVAPWGSYLEIVDDEGELVPDGCEGDVLVTCLTNFAMPLIRYRIGDRGTLAPSGEQEASGRGNQVVAEIFGRSTSMFRGKGGQLIHGGNFMVMLFFRDWIKKYQVIQEAGGRVVFRLVCAGPDHPADELQELAARTRQVMGDDCDVGFEFVDEIPASRSGKFRYIISEIADPA